MPDQRRRMSGVRDRDVPAGGVDHGVDGRHEIAVELVVEPPVDLPQDRSRSAGGVRLRDHGGLDHRGDQGSGDPVAGHVREQHPEPVAVDGHEVVEIAAHARSPVAARTVPISPRARIPCSRIAAPNAGTSNDGPERRISPNRTSPAPVKRTAAGRTRGSGALPAGRSVRPWRSCLSATDNTGATSAAIRDGRGRAQSTTRRPSPPAAHPASRTRRASAPRRS